MLSGSSDQIIKIPASTVTCPNCSLYSICSIPGLDATRQNRLDGIIRRRQPLQRGTRLFNLHQPVQSIFCIKSGSLKTYFTTQQGEEMITGFHLPGELVGLEAISVGHSDASATALETSSFCEIPLAPLQDLAEQVPALQKRVVDLMSREIAHLQALTVLLTRRSAEERLATFLLSISARFGQRGFSTREFHLRMTRNDIGNYLGLAIETVSRIFTRMNDNGIISVNRRYIRILDMDRLREMAGNPNYSVQAVS